MFHPLMTLPRPTATKPNKKRFTRFNLILSELNNVKVSKVEERQLIVFERKNFLFSKIKIILNTAYKNLERISRRILLT